MKNVYIDICNANNGEIPRELTMEDVNQMRILKEYNWEEYLKKTKVNKHFDLKTDERKSKTEIDPF
tara:strand:+ start:292 stop:489 length:198 start_codon:yes stop_codon:yes gene_type:complete